MSVASAVTIEDLRLMAMRRLPRMVFDYIDGGAEREWTLRENSRAFQDVLFRPRSAVATRSCDLTTTVLGTKIDLPIVLAPVGSSRMFYPRGEEEAASAAGEAGTIYSLSTLSGCTLEDVKAATNGSAWYQLYLVGGRDVAMKVIGRAKAAGYKALVVTIDTPVAGMRERDARNGVKQLLARNLSTVPHLGQMLVRPGWLYNFFGDGGLMNFPNIVLADGPMGYADVGAALEASMTSWEDFKWIRDAWGGPIVAKGVHTADDARRAVDRGRVGDRGVESRCAATRRRGADHSRAARSGAGGEGPDRDPARRRHPPRQRRGEGAVHGRQRGAHRPRLRLRAWRRRPGRSGAGHRHPENRRDPHDETAGLFRHQRS